MGSDKKISVSFASKDVYKYIKDKSKELGISNSRMVEMLVHGGIRSLNHAGNLFRENEPYLNSLAGNFVKNKISLVKEYSSANKLITKTMTPGIAPDKIYLPFSIPYKDCFIYKQKTIQKGNIIRQIQTHLLGELTTKHINYFSPCPELILLFIRSATISFSISNEVTYSTDSYINLVVTLDTIFIPVYFGDNITPVYNYLDFSDIAYRTYKSIAIEPPKKIKYSKLLLIEDVTGSSGGGYFIGLTSGPIEHCFPTTKNFHTFDRYTDYAGESHPGYIKVFWGGLSFRCSRHEKNKLLEIGLSSKLRT